MTNNALKQPLSRSIGYHVDRRANDFSHVPAKGLPCRVTKVEKDIITIAFEGSNGIWNMPTRKISQAFSPYGRDPTQVGDKGYASPSDYHIGQINKLGDVPSNWKQRGNLTPLVFHPISKAKSEARDYDQLTHAGGPTGVKIIQTAKQPKEEASKPPDQPSAASDAGDASDGALRRAWRGSADLLPRRDRRRSPRTIAHSWRSTRTAIWSHHQEQEEDRVACAAEGRRCMARRGRNEGRALWAGDGDDAERRDAYRSTCRRNGKQEDD